MQVKVTKHFYITYQPPPYLCQVILLLTNRLITWAVFKT